MQINWESIASLKDTRTDIWILIPTGVIVNRLLDKSGELKHKEINIPITVNEFLEFLKELKRKTGMDIRMYPHVDMINL
jgi:hypothetical protein